MSRTPASLRALLRNLIDYAGLYPPASLPLTVVMENYEHFRVSPESWILNRLVLPAVRLKDIVLQEDWRITLLVDSDPGPLPRQVETLETRQLLNLSLPTYCEVPVEEISGGFAKLRMGGLVPESIPDSRYVSQFLCAARDRRLPFKATAGLHHPIRSRHPLTNSPDGPHAIMHGFVNLFAAACFAWQGMGGDTVTEILNECDPAAFRFFDDKMCWRASSLATGEIESARREFAHSFGSCSFEEPIADLRELGLLP